MAATAMSTPAAGDERQRHPFPLLNQMVAEPFYLLHLITFSSYFTARASASSDLAHHLLRREIQAVVVFLVLSAIKMVREESWEAIIADTLLYAKGLLFAVALVLDFNLALIYLMAFFVLYALTPQPPYDGLGDASHLTPLQLESILTEGSTSRFWLVEFRAWWSPTCVRTSRLFAELSTVYSNKHISFGIVDLGHFPNVAEMFGISSGGQLPTYILFENAVEIARFPEVSSDSKVLSPTITKNFLCRHFELDQRLIEYITGK